MRRRRIWAWQRRTYTRRKAKSAPAASMRSRSRRPFFPAAAKSAQGAPLRASPIAKGRKCRVVTHATERRAKERAWRATDSISRAGALAEAAKRPRNRGKAKLEFSTSLRRGDLPQRTPRARGRRPPPPARAAGAAYALGTKIENSSGALQAQRSVAIRRGGPSAKPCFWNLGRSGRGSDRNFGLKNHKALTEGGETGSNMKRMADRAEQKKRLNKTSCLKVSPTQSHPVHGPNQSSCYRCCV